MEITGVRCPWRLLPKFYKFDWAPLSLARIFRRHGWTCLREDEIDPAKTLGLCGDALEDYLDAQSRERCTKDALIYGRQPSGLLISKVSAGRLLRFWIKPHVKGYITWHRNRAQAEVGFSYALPEVYNQLSEATETEVYCIFFHQEEDLVLGFSDTARRYAGRFYYGEKMDPEGMAFYRASILRKISKETIIKFGRHDEELTDDKFFESHEGWVMPERRPADPVQEPSAARQVALVSA